MGTAGRRVRVFVVDDHAMFASSIARVLQEEADLEVTGTAPDLATARARLLTGPVDVLLLDQHLPDGRGVAEIEALKALSPGTKIVVVTAEADDATLMAAVEAGCAGFLLKSSTIEDLVHGVRAVADGETVISPGLLQRLFGRLQRGPKRLGEDLTARELDVLALLVQGLSNAAIGARLFVTVNTVRNHVANILDKLGVHSKLEAMAVAIREGLVDER
jgi:DNA-binding NarL/FixJ family response regulator